MMNALIIPVYKNEESIAELLDAVRSIGERHAGNFTAVFVVDGSPDRCHELLEELLPTMDYPSLLILHSRNFGSFAAIRTGLQSVEAAYYAVMSADMQEPPRLATDMVEKLSRGEADVVIGTRNDRRDPWMQRTCANLFWGFYRSFVMKEIPRGGVDIFGCNRRVRDVLIRFQEMNSSLIGQLFWVGFTRTFVSYDRSARAKGKSAWTVSKRLNYLFDSIFAFTDLPIKLLLATGTFGMVLSSVFGLTVIAAKVLGLIPVSGYAATILTIIFFGTVHLFVLGIIGTYMHRTYENTKGRPFTIVQSEKPFAGGRS